MIIKAHKRIGSKTSIIDVGRKTNPEVYKYLDELFSSDTWTDFEVIKGRFKFLL